MELKVTVTFEVAEETTPEEREEIRSLVGQILEDERDGGWEGLATAIEGFEVVLDD